MAYFTEVGSSGHVIACVHATDRLTYPGEPLFNEETVPKRVHVVNQAVWRRAVGFRWELSS